MDSSRGLQDPQRMARQPLLTTGDGILDEAFGGGLSCKGITEIVGENATGKTQLALQLLLTAQLPIHAGGREGTSMYLHTEPPFPLRRLQQIASNMGGLPQNAMDRVLVNPLHSADHLVDLLLRMDVVVQTSNMKLLIIESIASLFRGVYSNTKPEMEERTKFLYKIRALLNSLTQKYGVAVVVTNQVVDVIDDGNASTSEYPLPISVRTSGREVRAALGRIWGRCVDARVFLTKEEVLVRDYNNHTQVEKRRGMEAVWSKYTAKANVEFTIGSWGVSGCSSRYN